MEPAIMEEERRVAEDSCARDVLAAELDLLVAVGAQGIPLKPVGRDQEAQAVAQRLVVFERREHVCRLRSRRDVGQDPSGLDSLSVLAPVIVGPLGLEPGTGAGHWSRRGVEDSDAECDDREDEERTRNEPCAAWPLALAGRLAETHRRQPEP
eukprot:scaffold23490_cov84-Isochrysis_galbana.AAC.2